MSTTAPSFPVAGPNPLRQRLAALRWRLRFITVVFGISWLLSAVLGAAIVACFLDWSLHLPALVRAVLLVGSLTGAGIVAFRYLIQPLSTRVDDLTLALRVEDHYPTLNDALASTVQFLEQTGQTPDSSSLRREAVRRALERAKGCDFNRIVPTSGLRFARRSESPAG